MNTNPEINKATNILMGLLTDSHIAEEVSRKIHQAYTLLLKAQGIPHLTEEEFMADLLAE